MTQSRTGYPCADNAGHDGLRAWIRSLQASFTYWSGRLEDSLRYTQLGIEVATNQARGSAGVRMASCEARTLAALNRWEEAHTALARASDLRDRMQPDELDGLGGICTFSRPRQLYFVAETLCWGGQPEATRAERLALEALDAYAAAPAQERLFGDEARAHSALALARVSRGEVDGAAEALAPVLELPSAQRTHGIVTAVEQVRTALSTLPDPGREVTELAGAIEAFTSQRLTRPQ